MSPPLKPTQLSDADLWEYYRGRGLSAEDATLHVERRRSTRPKPATPSAPTKGDAALAGAAQGASFGFAPDIVGAQLAIMDKANPVNRETIQQNIGAVRSQFNEARGAHPLAAMGGNVVGTMLNPVSRVLPAPTNAVRGAVTGGVMGGLQGFGEAQGSFTDRLPKAVMGAAIGLTTGALTGPILGQVNKLAKRFAPVAQTAWRKSIRLFQGQKLPMPEAQANAEIAAETAVRQAMLKAQHPPEIIEHVIQTMKAGKQLPTAPGPQVPVAIRPGETLVQRAPREFEVHGTRATPPVPTAPTILEMQTGQSSRVQPKGSVDPWSAARNAYNVAEAGGVDPVEAARRAAGYATNFSPENWDPRQALILMLLAGQGRQRP